MSVASAAATFATTTLEFVPSAPGNLYEVLQAQVERYMAIGAYASLELGEVEYRRALQDPVEAYIEQGWSQEQGKVGLLDVGIFDPRLSGEFLAKIENVDCRIKPDACSNYEGVLVPPDTYIIKGVLTPADIYVAQIHLGSKWMGVTPNICREAFRSCEQGLTVQEGLTVVALRGHKSLRIFGMALPGSVSEIGSMPYLRLDVVPPYLNDYMNMSDHVFPYWGSASRGRIPAT